MKALRKLLAGTILVALAALGLTALTSSSTNSADTRVLGFLNETCSSPDLILFQNMIDLVNFNGTTMYGVTWTFESYINVSDYEFTDNPECRLMSDFLAIPEVRTVQPKPKIIPVDPPPGGGGGGGGPSGPSASELAKTKTDDHIEALKSCWERKAGNKLKKNGWDINATTAATWTINRSQGGAVAQVIPSIKEVRGEKKLFMKAEIYPLGIAQTAVHFSNQDEEGNYYRGFEGVIFDHVATYGQMHETYHMSDFLKIFNERKTLPEPWEYWQMEVDAHTKSKDLWVALYDDPPPSFLPRESQAMTEEYTDNTARYKELKEKEEAGTLIYEVDEDGKVITDEAKELEDLGKWLKRPANLPKAENNLGFYKPSEVENFECEEEEEDE